MLNGITDNGINWLMGSNLSHLTNTKSPFPPYCMFISLAYLYQSVIGISLSLSQSDPIKRRPLYNFFELFMWQIEKKAISQKTVNHLVISPITWYVLEWNLNKIYFFLLLKRETKTGQKHKTLYSLKVRNVLRPRMDKIRKKS